MMFDPYAEFIKAVASDPLIFHGKQCVLSGKARDDIGRVIEGHSHSVATTYLLDRAKRSQNEERTALLRLQVHIRNAISNGLNSIQLGYLVRKMDNFPDVVEAIS